jgi:hypothetical protein
VRERTIDLCRSIDIYEENKGERIKERELRGKRKSARERERERERDE